MSDEFEKAKLCFQQNYEQFRSLNQIMWQVPVIAVTINGGLWFAAATITTSKLVPLFSLSLAIVLDVAFIFVLLRVRYVMDAYMTTIKSFSESNYPNAPGNNRIYTRPYVVVRAFVSALSIAAFLSFATILSITFEGANWSRWTMNGQCEAKDKVSAELARQYESIAFADVHSALFDLLPTPPARVLDIGSGSGRDAAALAKLGHEVTAIEPSPDMRSIAKALHRDAKVIWIDDCLPNLKSQSNTQIKYQLILASAVIMYVPEEDRLKSLIRMRDLLAPGGVLFVTLRHSSEETSVPDIKDAEFRRDVTKADLKIVKEAAATDVLGRAGISWTSFALNRNSP